MAAYSYEFKLPGLVKAPAQEVGELFEKLERSPDGLSPSSVLNASRSPDSLLHNEFDWNDTTAAEKYRLSQARFLIQNLTIVTKTTDREEAAAQKDRAFVITPGYKSAYVALDNALSNSVWRQHLIKTAKQDMEVFCAKYARLQELASVIKVMKKQMEGL